MYGKQMNKGKLWRCLTGFPNSYVTLESFKYMALQKKKKITRIYMKNATISLIITRK